MAIGRPSRWTRRQQIAAAAGALLLLIAVIAGGANIRSAPAVATRSQLLPATPEPGGRPVELDTTLYLPAHTPAPAVLLAHGFGGSKNDLDGQARSLARAGFVVLAYTARGFGRSQGLIHLDAPNYEVADARRMIDYLATLGTVRKDAANDPKVGVAGASYGGALALLVAGYDKRVDAVAADITWNDLTRSLLPNFAETGGKPAPGAVFKKLWAAYLFGAGSAQPAGGGATGAGAPATGAGAPATGAGNAQCGRFAAELCRSYQSLAQGKVDDPAILGVLAASSPATVLKNITAPTLLSQGEQDSLFPLGEADANARGIAAHGTPVSVLWRLGGHDTGGGSDVAQAAAKKWFDDVLLHGKSNTDFTLTLRGAGISSQNGQRVSDTLHASAGYPGVDGAASQNFRQPLAGGSQVIDAPAGGSPAAISSLPGLSDLLDLASGTSLGALSRLPGQTASFETQPFDRQRLIAGASTVALSVAAHGATDATLFVAVHDIAPDGTDTLPSQLVNAVELASLSARTAQPVTVTLPSVLYRVEAGHRLRVTVSTTDQGYLLPTDPRTYRIALAAGATLSIPTLSTTTQRDDTALIWLVVGIIAAVAAVAAATLMSRRTGGRVVRTGPAAAGDAAPDTAVSDAAQVPVVVTDLVKEYSDGFRAVDGVSFRVESGQIVGLLGPNGAGKTTTLRVLMGLIRPTSGTVAVFGETIRPGAAVLSRVGAFIEGPGLLPHLSGRDNLRLYWAASGRPTQEAQLETALEIAGLGSSIERRVKTYSQGMRQRLALAQSMLGLPELLVLDEPTNGLDPPQIAEMRQVLRSYAATGRTVVISSHLLAEVEQTCSHVVVMHRGRLVAAGSVADVAGADAVTLSVPDPQAARVVLAGAGIVATEIPARRALEDVFLELVGEER